MPPDETDLETQSASEPRPEGEPKTKKAKIDDIQLTATKHSWGQKTRNRFPELHRRTYFRPPVYMNKMRYELQAIAGQPVCIIQASVKTHQRGDPPALQESQVRNDRTHQRILKELEKMAEKKGEVMLVISQLKFKDYLGDLNYASEASKFPRPIDLKKENKHRGDFDMIIIHRKYGLIISEIKAIGDSLGKLDEQEKNDKILEKVQKALSQLDKAEQVLQHLVSDLRSPKPKISKVLMLPNISRQDLKQAISCSPRINEDLRKCLGIQEGGDPTDVIMCDDQLQEHCEVVAWWGRLTSHIGEDSSMTDRIYEELVARFAGPATNLSVWNDAGESPGNLNTEGEGVSETGDRFMRLTLRPEQRDVLEKAEPCAFLCGPPGTGKTVTLQLRARLWLREEFKGCPIYIVSTWSGSIAASHLIRHELLSADFPEELVRLHHFDLKEENQVDDAVEVLLKKSEESGHLCVIADEAFCGREFGEFCTKLHNNTKLCMWGASVYHGFRPDCLKEITFSKPLRTPPVITKKVMKSSLIADGYVHKYHMTNESPLPAEGPRGKKISHGSRDHRHGWAGECEQCGVELAAVLKELNIGQSGQSASPTSPPPLSYRDVFLLTSTYELVDEETDKDGVVTSAGSGLLAGLRGEDIPFKVVSRGDSAALREVAEGSPDDAVVVADADSVRGLERKVVIWVPYDKGVSSGEMDFARLDAMSRATAQLVLIA